MEAVLFVAQGEAAAGAAGPRSQTWRDTWPKVAPNFLCFRWGGQVRQVNRVKSFEIVPQLSDRWPRVAPESDEPHIVYELGFDIPIPSISTKGTYATGRVGCLLDQLLVQPTLADAVRASKELARQRLPGSM